MNLLRVNRNASQNNNYNRFCDLYFTAPSDVPQNITVIALAATTAQLTWEPPPPEHRNGNIEEYIINITGVDTNEEYELYFKQTFATVSDLHPFYQYKFSIAAATIAVGPFSSLLILQMPETCK